MSYPLDLIVLTADADADRVLRTLLSTRLRSLRIRPVRVQFLSAPGHDPGVLRDGPDLLRPYLTQATRALALLDREGSGQEDKSPEEIEVDMESRLQRNGWGELQGNPRAAAIVLDPELETWVWCRSPRVAKVIGLAENQLSALLASLPLMPNGKPERPKEVFEAALRRSKRPYSSRIFQELAASVSLRVRERAFDKLRMTLRAWFPEEDQT